MRSTHVFLLAACAALCGQGALADDDPATLAPRPKAATAAEVTEHKVFPADELEWGPGPESFPPGAEMVVLDGNPREPGPFTFRLRLPAGYKVMPHQHPAVERATVISGSIFIALGDKFDRKKGKKVSAGAFLLMPANTSHYGWTDEGVVLQVHGVGPWRIQNVLWGVDAPKEPKDKPVPPGGIQPPR